MSQPDIDKILAQQAKIMTHHDTLAAAVNRVNIFQQLLESKFERLEAKTEDCLKHFQAHQRCCDPAKEALQDITSKLQIIKKGLWDIDEQIAPVYDRD